MRCTPRLCPARYETLLLETQSSYRRRHSDSMPFLLGAPDSHDWIFQGIMTFLDAGNERIQDGRVRTVARLFPTTSAKESELNACPMKSLPVFGQERAIFDCVCLQAVIRSRIFKRRLRPSFGYKSRSLACFIVANKALESEVKWSRRKPKPFDGRVWLPSRSCGSRNFDKSSRHSGKADAHLN